MNSVSIFAGVDQNGTIRFVGDVLRGAACGCRCEACGAPLVAKRGEVNVWHFAHESSQERPDCYSGAVNLLRRLAIEQIKGAGLTVLPRCSVTVTASPPLPRLQVQVEWEPAKVLDVAWVESPSRHAPVAHAVLTTGSTLTVWVEVDGMWQINRMAVPPERGALLFELPLPTEAGSLRDMTSARSWIESMGVWFWIRTPDSVSRLAPIQAQVNARAQRLYDERQALKRMGERGRVEDVGATTDAPARAQHASSDAVVDDTPWAGWRKPRSSMIFYGPVSGPGWLLMQHADGRAILLPWPAEEGWDEALPARLGHADFELGGYVLKGDVHAMIYLRPTSPVVKNFSTWAELIAFRPPPVV